MLLTVPQKNLRIFKLVVEIVEIDTGVHTAVDNNSPGKIRLVALTHKNKGVLRDEISAYKIFFLNRCSDII